MNLIMCQIFGQTLVTIFMQVSHAAHMLYCVQMTSILFPVLPTVHCLIGLQYANTESICLSAANIILLSAESSFCQHCYDHSFLFVTSSEKRMHFYDKSLCFQAAKLFAYLVTEHGPYLQLYLLQLVFPQPDRKKPCLQL